MEVRTVGGRPQRYSSTHSHYTGVLLVGHTCRGSLSAFQGHALVGAPKGSLPSPLKLCQNATLKRSLHKARRGAAQHDKTRHGA